MPTYVLAVENLFRVEEESEQRAKEVLMERIGEDPFIVDNVSIVEVEDE